MLKIWNNRYKNDRFLFVVVLFLVVLVIGTMPTAIAKYITQAELSDQARVAKFDVEVTMPEGWLIEGTNHIIFTKLGNIEELEVPILVQNNSEVKVRCNVFVTNEQGMVVSLIPGEPSEEPPKEWEIEVGREGNRTIEIPESASGKAVFELVILIEQVD